MFLISLDEGIFGSRPQTMPTALYHGLLLLTRLSPDHSSCSMEFWWWVGEKSHHPTQLSSEKLTPCLRYLYHETCCADCTARELYAGRDGVKCQKENLNVFGNALKTRPDPYRIQKCTGAILQLGSCHFRVSLHLSTGDGMIPNAERAIETALLGLRMLLEIVYLTSKLAMTPFAYLEITDYTLWYCREHSCRKMRAPASTSTASYVLGGGKMSAQAECRSLSLPSTWLPRAFPQLVQGPG